MDKPLFSQDTERSFAALEERLGELIQRCQELDSDKRDLKSQVDTLQSEQQTLIEQHRRSRQRIDAMVARFNGLERDS